MDDDNQDDKNQQKKSQTGYSANLKDQYSKMSQGATALPKWLQNIADAIKSKKPADSDNEDQ